MLEPLNHLHLKVDQPVGAIVELEVPSEEEYGSLLKPVKDSAKLLKAVRST